MKYNPEIYNPKIARFMGELKFDYQVITKDEFGQEFITLYEGAKAKQRAERIARKEDGECIPAERPPTNYHESPADLQNVLVAICKKTGRTIQHNIFNFTKGVTHSVGIGLGIDATGATFEHAAYSAICQWIDRQSNRSENPNSSGGVLKDYNDPAKGYREEGGEA